MNQKRISHALVKNNNLKKTTLAIILFLLLATGLAFFIQPANAASVTIPSHSGYFDSDLGVYCISGEVQNLEATPVGWVRINVTYYDSSNTIIAVENAYTYAYVILPNRKEPFYIWLYNNNETQASRVDHYTLEVTPVSSASALPLGLKILSSSAHLDSVGWMHITGEVENTGTTNASSSIVYATCYDIDGKVVAVFHDTSTNLIPGQKLPFEILIQPEGVALAKSYVVGASSHEYASFEFSALPTPVNKAASVTILSHSGYLDSIGGYHIFGEVQNLDTAPVEWVNITATFYDSSNTIIAVEDCILALGCYSSEPQVTFLRAVCITKLKHQE